MLNTVLQKKAHSVKKSYHFRNIYTPCPEKRCHSAFASNIAKC